MRAVQLHDRFVPRGAAGLAGPEAAVSVGAGAIWMDVYDAVTTTAGRYVQGGGCTTVGVAGLVQGGGFGSFSKGLAPPRRTCWGRRSSPQTGPCASPTRPATRSCFGP